MKIIDNSAAHHFLTSLDKIKDDKKRWAGLYISLSRRLSHKDLISKPEHIRGKLHKLKQEADNVVSLIKTTLKSKEQINHDEVKLYIFSDFDVVLLLPTKANIQETLSGLQKSLVSKWPNIPVKINDLSTGIYNYQKLADNKLLAEKQTVAYEALADLNRTRSISLRRQRRQKNEKVILIIEDDRFSASYTANILNKKYDLVLAKTGEEGLTSYIDHAPDLVLLDIHLPGWSGHKTLQTIKKADPDAYIIMVSVDTLKDNVLQASQKGASGFIKKPFSKDRLLAMVQKCPHISK